MRDLKLTPRGVSTQALLDLLEAVQVRPREANHHVLRSYLRSQAAMATYSDQQLAISSCSLNTLKKSCWAVPGGFIALDLARRRALAALEENEDTETLDEGTSKQVLQARVKKLRRLLQASTEDLLLMTRLLERALRHGRQYAVDSRIPSLIERCACEQAEIRDMQSLKQLANSHLHVVENPN